jgi:hypothetical protein
LSAMESARDAVVVKERKPTAAMTALKAAWQ